MLGMKARLIGFALLAQSTAGLFLRLSSAVVCAPLRLITLQIDGSCYCRMFQTINGTLIAETELAARPSIVVIINPPVLTRPISASSAHLNTERRNRRDYDGCLGREVNLQIGWLRAVRTWKW
jgi:hypothetical protein